MGKSKNILDKTNALLKEGHPDLKETMDGLAPVYAKIIFSHRMEHGYSQQELAKKANVGLKTISRAEGGYDNLSTETYDKIFQTLNLSIREIAEAIIQLKSSDDELASTII